MRTALALLLAAAALAGCGDDPAPREARDAPAPRAATGADERVVEAWSDAMRRGDISAASATFALPATVANGTPETELTTRAQVRRFNASLPCGSRVTGMAAHQGLIIATFELTERPGADCGNGTGGEARAAFEVVDGKIVRWLRVPSAGDTEGGEPAGPVV